MSWQSALKKGIPGTGPGGKRIFTESERRRIRAAVEDGVSKHALAKRFGIGTERVAAIARGEE